MEGFKNFKEKPRHVEGEIYPPGVETPQDKRERETNSSFSSKENEQSSSRSFKETVALYDYMEHPDKLAQNIENSVAKLKEMMDQENASAEDRPQITSAEDKTNK